MGGTSHPQGLFLVAEHSFLIQQRVQARIPGREPMQPFLALHGSPWLLLAPPGSSWLLLAPPGIFLAPPGSSNAKRVKKEP